LVLWVSTFDPHADHQQFYDTYPATLFKCFVTVFKDPDYVDPPHRYLLSHSIVYIQITLQCWDSYSVTSKVLWFPFKTLIVLDTSHHCYLFSLPNATCTHTWYLWGITQTCPSHKWLSKGRRRMWIEHVQVK
jgi:hypothetical protein